MANKKILKSNEKPSSTKASSFVKTTKDKSAGDAGKTASSVTMEELLSKYSGTSFALKRGDRVKGIVVAKEPKKVIVDIGGKGEGIIAEKAFQEAREFIKTLKVGDEITAMVIVGETPDGFTILSLRSAMYDAIWSRLQNAKKEKKPLAVIVRSVSSSGLTVDIEGQYGFIPASQLGKEIQKDAENLTGKHLKAIVIDLDRKENKIVLSEKEVSEAEDIKLIAQAMDKVKEAEVYEGKVVVVAGFGAFVAIDVKVGKDTVPVEGLVHISEVSWGKTENIREDLREGDVVSVKVIGKKDGKLSLSIKQAKADPWTAAGKKYKKDEKYKGTVTKVSDYGVFIALEEGVEGLVHITKVPPGMSLKPKDVVNVVIEEIDTESKKISLGLVLTAKPLGYK